MVTLRIAVAQAYARRGNVPANVATVRRLIRAAAKEEAQLVVFPELFLCGYDPAAIASEPNRFAVDPDDRHAKSIAAECQRAGVAAVVGACVRSEKGLANSAIFFNAAGAVVDVYDKMHLWKEERRVFVEGERLLVVDFCGLRFGVAICYDAGFPEHTRALTLSGADAILCPSAFAMGDEEHRYDLYFPMRALENTVYVAVANVLGTQNGLTFFGRSAVYDPAGRPVATCGDQERVSVASVRRSDIERARRALPYLRDLRITKPPIVKGEA